MFVNAFNCWRTNPIYCGAYDAFRTPLLAYKVTSPQGGTLSPSSNLSSPCKQCFDFLRRQRCKMSHKTVQRLTLVEISDLRFMPFLISTDFGKCILLLVVLNLRKYLLSQIIINTMKTLQAYTVTSLHFDD